MARAKLNSKESAYHIKNHEEQWVAGCQTPKVIMFLHACVPGGMLSSDDLMYD